MGRITSENVTDVFTYHTPNAEQVKKMQEIRQDAIVLAKRILANVPECADRSEALRSLRNVTMASNAGIVLDGLI